MKTGTYQHRVNKLIVEVVSVSDGIVSYRLSVDGEVLHENVKPFILSYEYVAPTCPRVTVTLEVTVDVSHRYYGGDYEKYAQPITDALKGIPGVREIEWGGHKIHPSEEPEIDYGVFYAIDGRESWGYSKEYAEQKVDSYNKIGYECELITRPMPRGD